MSQEIRPINYDPKAALSANGGVAKDNLAALASKLEDAREETLRDVDLWRSGETLPPEKAPLDAGFITLPDRLLEDYEKNRDGSELGQILSTAHRIREACDRVVILGIGGSYMGARALFEACLQPYHNELSRGERGGRPRFYFAGNNVDNDATAALLDLVKTSDGDDMPWSIVVISKSGGTLETAVAFRSFLAALRESLHGDASRLSEFVVPVTGATGRLSELSDALNCKDVFRIPDGVGGRFSIFTAVGLLPAAILGLDVVKLLRGAKAMNEAFRAQPPGDNAVLDYVGVSHLFEQQADCNIRVLSTWGQGLEAVGLWYDQLLSESLGKQQRGATPITVVNTRDLHSRGQQHQEGRRDKLITNVIFNEAKQDPLSVVESELNQDKLNELADKTYPDILEAAFKGTNQAYADVNRPTATIRLPKLDEASLGQLLQMLMLATVVEGRLIGINPYGQPGVETYKKNMNQILREG